MVQEPVAEVPAEPAVVDAVVEPTAALEDMTDDDRLAAVEAQLAALNGDSSKGDVAQETAAEPVAEVKVDPVATLELSVERAAQGVPEGFTQHPSQVNVEEGDEGKLPGWRAEQLQAKSQDAKEISRETRPNSMKARRQRKKEAELEGKRASITNILENEVDLLAAVEQLPAIGVSDPGAAHDDTGVAVAPVESAATPAAADASDPLEEEFVQNEAKRVERQVTATDVGSTVTVEGIDGKGTLEYFGPNRSSGGTRCGVHLQEPVGKNNGTVKKVFYFTCPKKHGVLVAPSKVKLVARDRSEFGTLTRKILDEQLKTSDLSGETTTIKLDRSSGALGLTLEGAKDGDEDKAKLGVFVVGVKPGSVADANGKFQVGMRILAVNGNACKNATKSDVVSLVKSGPSMRMKLKYDPVAFQGWDLESREFWAALAAERGDVIMDTPAMSPVDRAADATPTPTAVTTSPTPQPATTAQLSPASEYDGLSRLKLVKLCRDRGLAYTAVSKDVAALAALLVADDNTPTAPQAAESVTSPVPAAKSEAAAAGDEIHVVLQKPLGLSISGTAEAGIAVTRVKEGSSSERAGNIQVGMRLTNINGIALAGKDKAFIVQQIKTSGPEVSITFAPAPAATSPAQEASTYASLSPDAPAAPQNDGVGICTYVSPRGKCRRERVDGFDFCSAHRCPQPGCKKGKGSQAADCGTHTAGGIPSSAISVTLDKPLGISISGTAETGMVVSRVKDGSSAAASGKVEVGMVLVGMDGESLAGRDKDYIVARIKAAQGAIVCSFTQVEGATPQTAQSPSKQSIYDNGEREGPAFAALCSSLFCVLVLFVLRRKWACTLRVGGPLERRASPLALSHGPLVCRPFLSHPRAQTRRLLQ